MRRIHPLLRVLLVLGLVATAWWWGRSRPAASADRAPAATGQVATGSGNAAAAGQAAASLASGSSASAATAPAVNLSASPAALARLTYAQAWGGDLPTAFAAFREWTGRYVSATQPVERVALEGEGLALARARRVAMKQLIEHDPRAALESTVPLAIRSQLPAAVVAELEARFSAVGDFSVLVFDYGPKELIRRQQMGLSTVPVQQFVQWAGGAEVRAYVYGRREGQTTKTGIPLHGVLLDGVAALHESAVRVLETGETPSATQPFTDLAVANAGNAGAASTATLSEIGGKIFRFASPAEVVRAEQKFAAAEAGIGPNQIPPIDSVLGLAPSTKSTGTSNPPDQALAATSWTIGNKKILVIRVDFSDLTGEPKSGGSTTYTAAYVENLATTQVAPFYVQSSFGAVPSLTTTATTQVYRMPQTASAYAVAGNNTQLHTDARTAAAANYTLANYDRVVVLFSNLGGLTGSQITYGGLANVGGANAWVNGEWDFRVVAHELGHTWGLLHANLWQVTDGNPVSATGTSTEYGDDFDTMGANFANDQRTDFNPWFKNRLGWVNDSQVQTITSTGTYRVNRFDNATGTATPLALKVVRDATRSYYIGARRTFTTNSSMQHGAYVIWGYNTNHQSDVLDLTTPGASPIPTSAAVSDAALAIGSTLLDTVGNVSIKLVSEGGTAPNEYIDVLVTVGLNGLPVISVQPQTQGYTVGATVTLSVTATGTAPILYQWRKNGTDIAGATSATYTITNAQAFHAGTYTVQLSNTVATIVSSPATLAVNATPVITTQPVNISATAGLTATFSVGVTGFPAATYQWRRASANIAGATSSTYAIASVQSTHADNYDVVVTNTLGSATSNSVSLTVVAAATPPSNDNFSSAWVLPGTAGIALGSNVGATGETGEPTHLTAGGTASSVWYRWTPTVTGNAQIDTIGSSFDSVLAVYSGSVLTALTQLKSDDDSGGAGGPSLLTLPVSAGTTYSIAVGSFDSATRGSVTLNYVAAAPPVIATQPVGVVSSIGGVASFSVTATGAGPITYQWFHNGFAIAAATSSSLALGNLVAADAGTFYCVITSPGGSVTSNTVTLSGSTAAPSITLQPSNVTATAGQATTLSVTATGTGTLVYQWRRNGIAIAGATAASYALSSATRLDADYYDVLVYAGLTSTASQVARLSVAPSAYPTLVAPDVAWELRPEAAGSGSGYTSVSLADGRAYIGGTFTNLDGTRRTGVARLNVDGTLDATFAPPEIDNSARALAVQSDGKLLVGGDFVRVAGLPRGRLVRLNSDGTLDSTFVLGSGFSSTVYALAVQTDGRVLVGGAFTSLNGTAVSTLVRLNADGSRDTSYAPVFNDWVLALALQSDGQAIAGGWFTTVNSTTRLRVARLASNGTLDTTFGSTTGLNSIVNALVLDANGKVVVGGSFTAFGATVVGDVARLNTDGSLDAAFTTASGGGFNNALSSLAVQADGKILAGGSFSTYAGVAASSLVRLNTDGTRDTGFLTTGMNSTVNSLTVQASGKIVVGGVFSTHTSTASVVTNRSRFARLNADGSLDTGINLALRSPGSINTLLPVSGGKSIITGYFTHLRGTSVPTGIARINADGTVDTTFNSGGFGANSNIYAAALQPDGKILITGFFTSFNSTTANRLARLNADGTLDPSFNAGVGLNSAGYTLGLLPGGKIFVGGSFTTAGGLSRTRVAGFNADGTLDATFDSGTGANSTVYTSAVQADGKIVIGGGFTTYNSTPANYIARLAGSGALDLTFSTTTGANSTVTAVSLQPDGKVLLGGFFGTYKSTSRSGVARVNTDATLDTTFVPPSVGSVYGLLLQEDGRVLLRGAFSSVGGAATTTYLGRLNADGTRDTAFGVAGFAPASALPAVFAMRDNGQMLMQTGGVSGLSATTAAAAPVISTPPLTQAAAVGANVTLSVTATSVLPLSYQWSFNTAPVVGATSASLALPGISSAQAGNYAVVVSNELGSTPSAIAVLTVGSAVAITTPPSAASVLAGSTATFTVVATGSPAPTYQWQRQPAGTTGFSNLANDATYAGATSATLTITPTTVAMRGDQFQCVVSNGVGAPVTTTAATLTVSAPPVFTSANSATFTATQLGSFTVTATGTPTPTFSLTAGTLPSGVALNATTGVISGAPPNNTGSPFTVTLTASNGVAPAATQVFTLIVLPLPVAPAITTPPVGQVVGAGATITLTVVASGTPAPSFQWRRNTVDIAGATSATFTRPNAALADAGSYTVFISNSAGNVTSTPVTVSVIPLGTSAQHAVVRSGYTAGGTVTVMNTLTYAGTATSASWQVLLPAGWSFASSTGDTGAAKPSVGAITLAEWTWAAPSAGQIAFSYTLNVPAGTTGNVSLVASATVVQSGATIPLLAQPDPLVVAAAATRHTADSDGDGKIGLIELTRVIELYNVRLGTTRTGAYKLDATTEDGFATDGTRSGTAALVRYHTADTNHDAQFGLIELTRVIELYNTRSGTTRTGAYHVQAGSEDGFAPGP